MAPMPSKDALVEVWDTGHWELGEAFKGLDDASAWVRAHPNLLSIGEIAAHIAYWEAVKFVGKNVDSPLVNEAARYYTSNLQTPMVLDLGADAIYREVQRVHALAREKVLACEDVATPHPYHAEATWANMLQYAIFHVAYHCGQIYSVRHLLGHQTEDN